MSRERRGHGLVLVVLRGFPGYQCPYCVRQVHDFIDHASDFAAKNTRVLLVYPGPPAELDQHATEFLEKQAELPAVSRQSSIRPKLHLQLTVRGTDIELIFGVNDGVSDRVRTCRRSRI